MSEPTTTKLFESEIPGDRPKGAVFSTRVHVNRVTPKVTRGMLEAAHKVEIEHHARTSPGASIASTSYPLLKKMIEAAMREYGWENENGR